MCYDPVMSLFFATGGFITSYWLKLKRATPYLYMPVVYFSIMEIFQTIQYFSITYELYTLNKHVTTLSYIHICFQPIFFNMFQYGYSNKYTNTYHFVVYPLCFIGGLGMIMRLRNINIFYDNFYEYWLNKHIINGCYCDNYVDYFESTRTIAFIGKEDHVGWEVNLHKPLYVSYGMNIHWFLTFMLPTVVERTITIPTILYLVGLFTSHVLSDNLHVQPALWCLIHIPLMILAIYNNYNKKIK